VKTAALARAVARMRRVNSLPVSAPREGRLSREGGVGTRSART
jgi:hypothetical protein